jgi:hypothetical protein
MDTVAQWLVSVPLFPVVLGAGAVLSAVLATPLSRRLREPWWVLFGLGVGLALVLAATVTPAPDGITGACLRQIDRPLGPRGLLVVGDRMLNTWLTVPLGLCAGFLAVRRWWVLVVAFAVPFLVEGLQRTVPELARRCQFQDIVDNTWGLVLGAALGIVLGHLAGRRSRR